MPSERLSLLIESKTTGTAELQKLESQLKRVADIAESDAKKSTDATKRVGASFEGQAAQIRNAIQNPLNAATETAEKFALSYGKIGLVGVGITAGVTAAGAALFSLAKQAGALAEQQSNAALVLGVSVKEYGLLSQAAENAGVNADGLLTSMKALSVALSDNSDEGRRGKQALRELGVEATNAFGGIKPTKELLLELADALGDIPNAAERANAAQKVLGRPALQLLPLLTRELRGNIAELEKMGVGFDDVAAKSAKNFDDALDRLITKLKVFAREAGVAVAEAAGFADPAEEARRRQQRESERQQRFQAGLNTGRFDVRSGQFVGTPDQRLTQEELLGPSRRLAVPPVSQDDVKAAARTAAQQKINSLLGIENDITRAKQALQDAITDADVKRVVSAKAQVEALERQKKLLEDQKALIERLGTFKVSESALDKSPALFQFSDQIRGNLPGNITPDQVRLRSRTAPTLQRNPALGVRSDAFVVSGQSDRDEESARQRQEQFAIVIRAQQENEDRRRSNALILLRQETELTARKIELLAGPGGELAAAKEIAAIRIAALEREKSLSDDVFAIQREQAQVLLDIDIRRLELQKERERGIRNAGEQGFDAVLRGGGGIRSLILGQAAGIGRTFSGNAAVELFRGASGRLALPGQQNADKSLNVLGRLLQNTPFGVPPEKIALDANTKATIGNTTSLDDLSRALTLSGGTTGSGAAQYRGLFGGVALDGVSRFISRGQTSPDLVNLPSSRLGDLLVTNSPLAVNNPTAAARRSNLTRNVGYGAAVAGAGFGVYSGIQAGGVQGGLTAAGSALGAAALIPGPQQPFLMAGAIITGTIAALLGDPKQKRRESLSNETQSRAFTEPQGTSYVSDIYGRTIDYDYRGQQRTTVVYQTVQISAVDASSFVDLARRNGTELTSVVTETVNGGNADDLRSALAYS